MPLPAQRGWRCMPASMRSRRPPSASPMASRSSSPNSTGLPDDLMILASDPDPIRNWQRRGGQFKLVGFTGTQADPDERFDIAGEASLTERSGLVNAKLTYSGKGCLTVSAPYCRRSRWR